uniref:G-protein coupled receptors family 1 profile domain-containing protein n=1 Tax=Hucho hucho TaxID=62062 RepID=A0A4W5MLA6_9TELE
MTMDQLNISISNITSGNLGNVVSSTLMGLCCLVGLPANIAVVVVILRQAKIDNITLKLMLNLACSDILCLASLPVWIYSLLCGWNLGRGLCKFFSFTVYCSLYINIKTVTMMSVQRYVSVLYPHQWARLGRRGEQVLLPALWGLACILTGPSVATRNTVVTSSGLSCQRHTELDWERVAVLLFETLVGFLLGFILVTFYFLLHKRVNQTALFSTQRMTRLVTGITVTFIILWVPGHVVNIVDISATLLKYSHPVTSAKLETFGELTRDFAKCLTFVNSCVDPFLYAFAFQRIWQRRPDKRERADTAIQTCV